MDKSYGFVAFWKSTDLWYGMEDTKRQQYLNKIAVIQEDAKEKGIQMFGNFDCCWSSEWHYFTFWLCPNIEVLEETMKKLTEIGDINQYNIQHHYVGRML